MSHFWSSTLDKSYIEPKREYQGVGVIDFVQPFLIQSMTKPGFSSINTTTAVKFLKNGTIRTENHYNTGYKLSPISITIIDSFQDGPGPDLNKAETLYDLLTNGGYTLRSNQLGSAREALRFGAMQILELSPTAKTRAAAQANMAASAVTGFIDALGGAANPIGAMKDTLNAAVSATNFLGQNVAGVWTIVEPVITSANFGQIAYGSENFVTIKLNLNYNNFKYERSFI